MRFSSLGRVGVLLWPVVIGAVVLASCGSDTASGPSRSTLSLSTGSTAFIVKPAVTTLPGADGVLLDGTNPLSQEYEVQSGDYPLKVAEQFSVPLDDLIQFNGWASAREFPFPGTVIQIPPGGTAQGSVTAVVADDAAIIIVDPVGDEIPDAGDNCAEGEHTVAAGDFPLAVARKYDVTIEALAAANAANSAYSQFIPGQTIIIPAKADC